MDLITGGTGHLGNVLVRELLNQGHTVRVLVLPNESQKSLDGLNIEFAQGNILKPETIESAMQGVETVYHMAALVSICEGQDDLLHRVNVEGTENIINAARKAMVKRLVYTSSIHALSRPPEGVTIDESLPFDKNNPAGAYDRTKAEASLLVQAAVQNRDLDAVIVCPTGVVGPFDFRRSEMGELILDWMSKKLCVIIDGVFDFVDVRDVAQGHIQAANVGKSGQTYILSGERVKLEWMRSVVKSVIGDSSPMIKLPFNLAMFATNFTKLYYAISKTRPKFTRYSLETVVSNSRVSNQRAKGELGFTPRSMQQTIVDTVEWWLIHRNLVQATLRIE